MVKKSREISLIVGASLFVSLFFVAYGTYCFWLSYHSKWSLISVISGYGDGGESYKRAVYHANMQGYIQFVCGLILAVGFGFAAKGVSDLKRWGIQLLVYLMAVITLIGGFFFYSGYIELIDEINELLNWDTLVSFFFWVFLPGMLTFCFNSQSFKKQFI